MDGYYIKDHNNWLGPFSSSGFEEQKNGREELIYWTAAFCPNGILHPHLCSHNKTWIKPPEKIPEPTPDDKPKTRDVIIDARPISAEELADSEVSEMESNEKPKKEQTIHSKAETSITHKLLIIVIGFILVLGAGYYVNAKLGIMFYQDIIIQESVKDIEFYTRDMIKETREIRKDVDSLNNYMKSEFKAIREDIKGLKVENE